MAGEPKKKLGHKNVVKVDGTVIAFLRNFTPLEKARDEVTSLAWVMRSKSTWMLIRPRLEF